MQSTRRSKLNDEAITNLYERIGKYVPELRQVRFPVDDWILLKPYATNLKRVIFKRKP